MDKPHDEISLQVQNMYFLFDFIIVPVRLKEHWSLALVEFINKTLKFYSSVVVPHRECLQVDEVLIY